MCNDHDQSLPYHIAKKKIPTVGGEKVQGKYWSGNNLYRVGPKIAPTFKSHRIISCSPGVGPSQSKGVLRFDLLGEKKKAREDSEYIPGGVVYFLGIF